ncbi:hypothetical protein [Teichococcus vastitatis]|uniref:Uncharacterized protein n=1 Tax=Teichococcus vastitatis TaxID=2307076 RepID=A0ABS9W0S6_9PROT|nr:hypothetical protein [Pseudoroseomonas vastitatis]MCI0752901.1 hypothetical protein [Pseudoroseomonas vastitatis]
MESHHGALCRTEQAAPHLHRGIAWALPLLALLAGCAAPQPPVTLPPTATTQAPSDPIEAALRGASAFFSASPQGDPAAAALAVAQLEFLAVEIPAGRSRREMGTLTAPALQAARHDVRAALQIPDAVPPQLVIDAMVTLAQGGTPPRVDAARLRSRLATLPRMPQANAATLMALRDWEFGPPQELLETAMLGRGR